MKLFFVLPLLVMLLITISSVAQSKTTTISGKVTSFEESLPLEGVQVQVKNSQNATGTQADGIFSLALSPDEKTLVISLAGYEKKEITVTSAKEYDIVLKRSNNTDSGQQLVKPTTAPKK